MAKTTPYYSREIPASPHLRHSQHNHLPGFDPQAINEGRQALRIQKNQQRRLCVACRPAQPKAQNNPRLLF